jgi:hypothetical protein
VFLVLVFGVRPQGQAILAAKEYRSDQLACPTPTCLRCKIPPPFFGSSLLKQYHARSLLPVSLEYQEEQPNQSMALKREALIRKRRDLQK